MVVYVQRACGRGLAPAECSCTGRACRRLADHGKHAFPCFRGSPSIASRAKETYRHAWSVTSHRPGLDGKEYLYTLTLSCPDEKWPKLGPLYHEAQQSFRLTKPTQVHHISLLLACTGPVMCLLEGPRAVMETLSIGCVHTCRSTCRRTRIPGGSSRHGTLDPMN